MVLSLPKKVIVVEKSLLIQVNCGEKTCCSEPGKLCPWLRVSKFGTLWCCQIFSEYIFPMDGKMYPEALEEKDGWLQRHPKCLAAEKELNSSLDFIAKMP